LQGTLLGAQVAFCMALSIGAALLTRGLLATQAAHPGFEYRNVTVASLDLLASGYDAPKATTFTRRLRERVDAFPGTEATAYALLEPLASGRRATRIRLPTQDETQAQFVPFNAVTPGYFSVVGIPIVRGRTFTDAELDGFASTAIVSETTAGRYWPGEDPIGETLLWTLNDRTISLQVIGVARDAQVTTMGDVDPYYVYLPAGEGVATSVKLLVRSRAGGVTVAAGVGAAARALDPGVVARVSPLEANLDYWRGVSGAVTGLATALGALALALASVGIYGVVAYFVGQRAREIGVRIALGARPRGILGLVLQKTMRPVVVGAALGVVGAVAVSDLLSSVLFGVSPVDPLGLSCGIALVLSIALTAALLAARRSMNVDPMVTLRSE
jgi:predicted permease